jgi:cyclic pyranopterin phosphate synthase
VNDDEVVDLAAFGREKGVGVRFIEFMPLDAQGDWSEDRVVPAREILERIDHAFPLERSSDRKGGGRYPAAERARPEESEPAERYAYADGVGDVGVIASVTEPFCENCDRIRITAEGKLRTCLFALDEFDLRVILRHHTDDDDATEVDERLAAEIARAVGTKWAGHRIGQVDFVRPERSMSQIGG